MAVTFGQRLKRLRKANGLTLQQIADEVGCTKAYIWGLENDRGRPTAERVQGLAKILGVTMEDLMEEQFDAAPKASPEDLAFFRHYVGMAPEAKDAYRKAMELMFDVGKFQENK